MSDNVFLNGLLVRAPRDGAPDFVKGSISIKRDELITSLSARDDEWINLDIKAAKKDGKWYASINDWKPDGAQNNASVTQNSNNDASGMQNQSQVTQQPVTPDYPEFDSDIPF